MESSRSFVRVLAMLWLLCICNSPVKSAAQEEASSKALKSESELSVTELPKAEPIETACKAALDFLSKTDLPENTKAKIIEAISSDPERATWSGRIGMQLYVVTARKIPKTASQAQMQVAVVKLASNLAHSNLLKNKAVLDYCQNHGFENEIAIREIELGRSSLSISGLLNETESQANVVGNYAIAYAIADEASIKVEVKDASNTEIRKAYGDALHRQMRKEMKAEEWDKALQIWTNLKSVQVEPTAAHLDAIHCLVAIEQYSESVSLAKEWIEKYGETADVNSVELLADKMLSVDSAAAQKLATTAFSLVVNRLTRRSTSLIEK